MQIYVYEVVCGLLQQYYQLKVLQIYLSLNQYTIKRKESQGKLLCNIVKYPRGRVAALEVLGGKASSGNG